MIQGNFWITKLYKISTADEMADAVWDEPEIDHVTVGTYGYDVPIRPLYKAGGGVNINYDTMATKVWSHDKAGNLIKMIKAIKVVTDKIVTYKDKIIEKIKGIKIPETKTVDFPEMPKLDLKPVLDKIDSIDIPKPKEIDLSPVLRRIDAIEIPEQMDYTDIIQNMLELLEKLKNKKLPNYDNQLDDIKRLIIDLTK